MNTMMKATLLATTIWATGASAATITYKDAAVVPYLPQFDPSLGTLQSVTFNNRYVAANYFYYNDPFATVSPVFHITGTIGDIRFGQVAVDQAFQSILQPSGLIGVNVTRSVSVTFTEELSYYTGVRYLAVAAFNNLTVPGLSVASPSFPSPYSYVSVTYNYIASVGGVPEPSTWLTMLVGFAMISGAARYRRRSSKVTYA